MKAKSIPCLLTVLLLIWTAAPAGVYAETRNIYVGDIITLEITAGDFSADELREKFHEFEILEIREKPDGYLLSLRTFEVGEHVVQLGDMEKNHSRSEMYSTEIVINVQSTLNDIQRDDIFEGNGKTIEPGFSFHLRILFYIAAGILILSGGFVLLKTAWKRKIKTPGPRQLFLQRSGILSDEDDNYLVDLTLYFKEYIESLYQCRIIGKTSTEIVNELKEIPPLETMLPHIQEWLAECDRLKFTGVKVSSEKKQMKYKKLIDLVEKIDVTFQQ